VPSIRNCRADRRPRPETRPGREMYRLYLRTPTPSRRLAIFFADYQPRASPGDSAARARCEGRAPPPAPERSRSRRGTGGATRPVAPDRAKHPSSARSVGPRVGRGTCEASPRLCPDRDISAPRFTARLPRSKPPDREQETSRSAGGKAALQHDYHGATRVDSARCASRASCAQRMNESYVRVFVDGSPTSCARAR